MLPRMVVKRNRIGANCRNCRSRVRRVEEFFISLLIKRHFRVRAQATFVTISLQVTAGHRQFERPEDLQPERPETSCGPSPVGSKLLLLHGRVLSALMTVKAAQFIGGKHTGLIRGGAKFPLR